MTDVISEAADEALGNAMYRFSFGIVGNGSTGAEGQGLATGIGILWKDTYLILTAAHTMQTTAYERLYFLLPDESVQLQKSAIVAQPSPVKVRRRVALEHAQSFLDNDEDLAAFVLPDQAQDKGQKHFYPLDPSTRTPSDSTQFGFLGFPGVTSVPVGPNFMATPYFSFGREAALPVTYDQITRIALSYPASHSVDPHGLSGCGVWSSTSNPAGGLWAPDLSLSGLVTNWDPISEVLIAYRVETLIKFLDSNDAWMRKD